MECCANIWQIKIENVFVDVSCLNPWLVDKNIIDIYVMIHIYMFIII
jgi:hypothetical protein